MLAVQGSLFEQPTDGAWLGDLMGAVTRRELSSGAWYDIRPGWVSGADEVLHCLETQVPWRSERRKMYDRVVDVPRQVCSYGPTDDWPHPLLEHARDMLSVHYRDVLPEGFSTAGMCRYRDGHDSVAWHGDTIDQRPLEKRDSDTLVAILSFGATRPLLLRPRGGGESLRLTIGHGDLFVMGGSCQRTWEHAIPKTTGVGLRISVQLRAPGVF